MTKAILLTMIFFFQLCKRLFQAGSAILLLCVLATDICYAQNCTANAGGFHVVCGPATTLTGTVNGTLGTGDASWTFVSGPTTPVIENPTSLVTNVSGMTVDGDYTFQLSFPCGSGTSVSNVTVRAHARPVDFTAGPDITGICASVGTAQLNGVIPAGFTGSWSLSHVYSSLSGQTVSTNATLTNSSTATPEVSLINKSNHETDPAYYATLTITSADGLCTYQDIAVVSFVPNPEILLPDPISTCASSLTSIRGFWLAAGSPVFTTWPDLGAGSVASGTTLTLNVISQPAGANMTFDDLNNGSFAFSGMDAIGVYEFNFDVANACGTHTTPNMTYTIEGFTPSALNFQPTSHAAPEQIDGYNSGGGEVHCDLVNTTTPQTFYFDINPGDSPEVITTVVPTGIIPGGVAPTVTVAGEGTMSRSVTVTPPAGGWQIGTYRFTITTGYGEGQCNLVNHYYIHISAGNREDVAVEDITICRESNDPTSAVIPLPDIYKGVVNDSYLQDYVAFYRFTVLSRPDGAAMPVYETAGSRSITSTSTIISNLTLPGEYVFEIQPEGSALGILEQEYTCSGTSLSGTFTVRVENKVNSNAGADQNSTCTDEISLQGNSPGGGTGTWNLVSSPLGSSPSILSPQSLTTQVSGVNIVGTYVFKWTIVSENGYCQSEDEVTYTVTATPTIGLPVQPTCSVLTGTIELVNLPSGNWTITRTGTSGATIDGSGSQYADAGLAPGSYQYSVTSEGGCTSEESDPVVISAASCKPPVANSVTHILPEKPSSGQEVTLNGAGSNPPAPYGQDTEDGPLGGSTVTSTIVISSIPNNGALKYDGANVTEGQTIPDFDASLLTIVFTGSGYSSTTFSYSFTDSDGMESNIADYTISWDGALPVTLVEFRASCEGAVVNIDWTTSAEINSRHFGIERSADGKNWSEIGRKEALKHNTGLARYTFTDYLPMAFMSYYRIRMVDLDLTYTYSGIVAVTGTKSAPGPVAYPNPATGTLFLKDVDTGTIREVLIRGINGSVLRRAEKIPAEGLSLSGLTSGIYIVEIVDVNRVSRFVKISVTR